MGEDRIDMRTILIIIMIHAIIHTYLPYSDHAGQVDLRIYNANQCFSKMHS